MIKKLLMLIFSFFLLGGSAYAQGVTTASINGRVTDEKGGPLPGANVLAVHVPSGTQYGTSTNEAGRYSLLNVRVGGPYTVKVSFVGFSDREESNINLSLGQSYVLNFSMAEGVELQSVEVRAAKDEILNDERTGASTSIGNEKVQTLPTISRSFNDFTRLTPQADIKGSGISIGGINNRFNQVTIDGAVSNDVFGLSATGTNGGQTGTSPISLDAIEEFQVVIAPFDVRLGGFAGGGISAITRSGTNEVEGSAYYYYRNEKLAGKQPPSLVAEGEDRQRFREFSEQQYGIRLGGPILKNKLFFFVNAEQTKNITPLSFAPGTAGAETTIAQAEAIAQRAREFGYDPGSYLDQETTNESEKLFGRLDWNISDKHKLTLRHSYTKGEAIDLNRSARALTFSNGAILRQSTTNATVLELNSRISNTLSNNLIVGYTTVREPRSTPGAPFPRVTITAGNNTYRLGTEAFSTVNLLEQDILTLTDNLSIVKGKHVLTVGTHNEFYDIYNAFIGQAYGDYSFVASPASDINPATGSPYTAIENWQRGKANGFTYQYSQTNDPREGANFRALQLGVYIQDEFQATDVLKLTGGVRLDVPIYLDNPLTNADFNNSDLAQEYNVKNDRLPKPAFMFSPRIGFNWDVKGDRSTQVRGGTGIFTSRFPFVWAGGAFTQSGVLLDLNRINTPTDNAPAADFNSEPFEQPKKAQAAAPGGRMTVIDNNFKLPQIFRTNIAVDQRLPLGLVGTLELMYASNINAFSFTNINLVEPSLRLGGADNRVLYPATNAAKKILPNYDEVVYIENVNEGRSYSLTTQVQRTFVNGFYSSLAYTYTRSEDYFPGTSSQNHSNLYRRANINGTNNIEVGSSPFDTRSRVVGVVSYRKEFLKALGTTVTLFYTGQSGAPFSFTYAGDLTRSTLSSSFGDHFNLIYVPKERSEILFVQNGDLTPDQQWTELNKFIDSNEYLRSRRGQYAERNMARTPFTHQFDLKFMQEVFTDIGRKRNVLQLTLDIFNVGNLINKDWGKQYVIGDEVSFFDNTVRVLQVRGYDANNTPQFTFTPFKGNQPWNIADTPIGGSRWVAQVGIRYIFN